MTTRREGKIKLLPDILAKVQKDFGADAGQALALLSLSVPETPRVLRCVLFLANGDLKQLAFYVRVAAGDYRDVIFWAEYVDHEKLNPKRVRDFNRAFPSASSLGASAKVVRKSKSKRQLG